ncbi:XFP domain-containing protein [Eremomyces bilateralis CBS 781.70]|uniref:XFP domain-containing protein n=1 Tax=Eremomyces bilateralis CBS 781.70 TaxID=1392243 RepID=A0A6G1FVX3_9PEZI|nr:XFP domain-containing protein [Eremomyces bilateralis CBS 781.70]KAF1809856.1 XFP domain-containing protein [Eremomyces bilateralis CBS 781.70]
MPVEVVKRPNPEPLPSHLPEGVQELAIIIEKPDLPEDARVGLENFRAAACFIAAAMIFLKDNVLLEQELQFDHVKPRLLGHWGTCPGLILVHAHLNFLIRKHDLQMIYVVGPGHGAPAMLATLWLEGSISRFYPEYSLDKRGLHNLISRFSVTGGFPSHINAETPGAIHEGGELGYALSVSFGAVMDKPDLIVACVIGDGEAETGPTATAWHGYKYIDPKESGAVLPILHVNGFKISERTIFGCMDKKELAALFSGYGYQVRFVENLDRIDEDMAASMEWALTEIRKIQSAARNDKPITKPRWPLLIMRTPKGWSGPKEVDGKIIEGSFHSHQVPLAKAKTDEGHLQTLKDWLSSYDVHQKLPEGKPSDSILRIIPEDSKKLGQVKESFNSLEELKVPDWRDDGSEKGSEMSAMQAVGQYMSRIFQANPHSIRLLCPDELESNKITPVFDVTNRNFQWDQFSNNRGGRVIEVLSEHNCQGFLQGYTLTGRCGIFASYESFLGIVHTMMVQYAKFIKIAQEVEWRGDVHSINYIETSTWTRQEHNGFSHQNPSFIGAVLNLKPSAARVFLPPDANCFLSTLRYCLRSKNYVNLMVGSKQPSPVFLTPDEADEHCRIGAGVWKFASTDDGLNPDVILVGIGTEVTFEVVKAAELLRDLEPSLRVRVVNVTDLMVLGTEGVHPHSLTNEVFDALFPPNRPVHINYHGYAVELRGLLFGRSRLDRVTIESYREEGSTTTPFDMLLLNNVSRYDVARYALEGGAKTNEKVKLDLAKHLKYIKDRVKEAKDFLLEHGKDPDSMYDMPQLAGLTTK